MLFALLLGQVNPMTWESYDKILEKNGIKPTMREIVLLKADEDAKKTEYEF